MKRLVMHKFRQEGQGDWWPRDGRYGVLETSGFGSDGPKYFTTYLVCDLAECARVVDKVTTRGRPGSARVMRARQKACDRASDLNFLDRVYEQSA